MSPTQCAVFLKDHTTSGSLAPDGRTFSKTADITCVVFDHLDAAQRFCDVKAQSIPRLRCEIYDAQGLAHPPMLVILCPEVQRKLDAGWLSSRCRKLLAGVLMLISVPLFWVGMRDLTSSDLATFLALNCVFIAARFLFWDLGARDTEEKRRMRLEAQDHEYCDDKHCGSS